MTFELSMIVPGSPVVCPDPIGASSIPQIGHLPGLLERTWGCIEHEYTLPMPALPLTPSRCSCRAANQPMAPASAATTIRLTANFDFINSLLFVCFVGNSRHSFEVSHRDQVIGHMLL